MQYETNVLVVSISYAIILRQRCFTYVSPTSLCVATIYTKYLCCDAFIMSCGNVMFLMFGFILHVFLKSHEQHSTLFDRTFGGPSVNKLQCYVTQSLQLERVSDPSIQRCNTAFM